MLECFLIFVKFIENSEFIAFYTVLLNEPAGHVTCYI